MRASLARLASAWDVPCDDTQTGAIIEFASLLLTWNARINLTGARSLEDLATEHLPDAFALASRLPDPAAVVDVGSGGGLPAIPLALLRRGLRLSLIEPIAKKVAFLRTAVRALDLQSRVQIHPVRVEAFVPGPGEEGLFDAAVSRATMAPAAWVEVGVRLVKPGGRVFALTAEEMDLGSDVLKSRAARGYQGGRRWLLELERST